MKDFKFWSSVIVLIFFLGSVTPLCAQEIISDSTLVDVLIPDTTFLSQPVAEKKQSWFKNWWNQFANGNIDRTFEKKFDVSWVVAPTYADDGGFGIGGGGSALFRLNRTDSVLPPSNVSLTANITLKAFYSIYFKCNLYVDRKNTFELYADLQSRNRYMWGTCFDTCYANTGKEALYRYYATNVYVKYLHKLPHNFYVGGMWLLNTRNVQKWEYLNDEMRAKCYDYLNGEDKFHAYMALGALVKYDTRDFIPNPSKGVHVMLQETCYRRLAGNGTDFAWNTIFNFNAYIKLWKGAMLAYDFYANCYDRNVPWTLKQEIASDYARMRGYYIGRIFDNNQMNTTLELRQHIWKRIGMTVWGGLGNYFSDWDDYEWKRWQQLPTFGVGFRLEFKKNVNARIDLGFGKDGPGVNMAFVFDMGEAY